MKVFIAHPDIQHSHQLALSFSERGCLQLYCSGVPIQSGNQSALSWIYQFLPKRRLVAIPISQRAHLILFPIMTRLINRLVSQKTAHKLKHRLNYTFDFFTALVVLVLRPDVVVAYENSAKLTFIASKRIKALCILDASSVHPDIGRELMESSDDLDPEWINQRKRREIELADYILCCSPFAAETYQHAVPANRIKVAILGTQFPSLGHARKQVFHKPIRFVFVGPASHRKGADILLNIFEGFNIQGIQSSLTFVGSISNTLFVKRIAALPNVHHQANLNQTDLFEFLQDFDCLVLPSRFDSFGMVVPECMALGLPAIVSDRVGAKCIIQEIPGAGWIEPCTEEAMRRCLMGLINHPEKIAKASAFALKAANQFSWSAYRVRVFDLVQAAYLERIHVS